MQPYVNANYDCIFSGNYVANETALHPKVSLTASNMLKVAGDGQSWRAQAKNRKEFVASVTIA